MVTYSQRFNIKKAPLCPLDRGIYLWVSVSSHKSKIPPVWWVLSEEGLDKWQNFHNMKQCHLLFYPYLDKPKKKKKKLSFAKYYGSLKWQNPWIQEAYM